MSEIVIKMTPFIFEDGNTYYFQIEDRDSSNDYHDLYVYKKVVIKRKFRRRFRRNVQINNGTSHDNL